MTPAAFIAKWRTSELKERSGSQEHFIDLCRLLGEPTPAEADPSGERYCFERGARKDTGARGWADVWKRHCFAWEYKGKHADLDAAFNQLRRYALTLGNPPLLVVCDMARFRIGANWTNSVSASHAFALEDLAEASVRAKSKWGPIEPDMPRRKPLGRRRRVALRAVVNAILYVCCAGCPWRMLAKGFPPWQTVSGSFAASGLWVSLDHRPARAARKAEGRAASPSAGVIDSQSAKTKESGGPRGFDAGKKVKGRKRRIVTDTCGFPVAAVVHPANIQDRDGAPELPVSIRHRFPWLRHIFAGGADADPKLAAALEGKGRWRFEAVKRVPSGRGFEVLPRRWAVERTLAWLSRNRRLAKDFEATIATARTWLFLGNVQILLRRLTCQKKQ